MAVIFQHDAKEAGQRFISCAESSRWMTSTTKITTVKRSLPRIHRSFCPSTFSDPEQIGHSVGTEQHYLFEQRHSRADTMSNSNITIPIPDPYPVPAVGSALVEKATTSAPVGVRMLTKRKNVVFVSMVKPNSMLQGTSVTEGAEILAINGEAVHSSVQAVQIIQANKKLEFTTIDRSTRKAPFCYVEVAPTSKINPGVSFDSCCDRSLVMISKVFVPDLEKTRLRVGDIVLAVNGIPVWKPEAADEEQLRAARASQALVLYCVNMDALRDHIARQAEGFVAVPTPPYDSRIAVLSKIERGWYELREQSCVFTAKVDQKTQLFDDQTDWVYRVKTIGRDLTSKTLEKKISYEKICRPTFLLMNHTLTQQLNVLVQKVVAKAWNFTVNKQQDEDESNVVYAIPSAPSAPLAIGMGPEGSNVPLATAFLVNDESATPPPQEDFEC